MTREQQQAQYLTALAQAGPVSQLPVVAVAGLEHGNGERQPGKTARRARASLRVVKAWAGFTLKRSPRWARVAAVACLAIPGPVDELVVWPALAVYVALRHWGDFAATVRQAWQGVAR